MVLIMLKEFGVNTIRNFECIYNRKIAAKLKNTPDLLIDHIVIYMLIAHDPKTFQKKYGEKVIYTERIKNILE